MDTFGLVFLLVILPILGLIALCIWAYKSAKTAFHNFTTTPTVDDGWVDITKETEERAEQNRQVLERVRTLLHSEYGLTLKQLEDICPSLEDYFAIKKEILALYNEGKLERKKDLAGAYHYRIKKDGAE